MQEEEKKEKPRRTWRGFTSADGITDYTVYRLGDKIKLVAKQEIPGEEDEVADVEMSLADFKELISMAQDILCEAEDDA